MSAESHRGDGTDRSVAILGALTHDHPANEDPAAGFGHPTHQGFAESVGADPIGFETAVGPPLDATMLGDVLTCLRRPSTIPEYDVYITENSRLLYAVPFVKAAHPDATVVYLATDYILYGMNCYALDRSLGSLPKYVDRRVEVALLRSLARRYVDAAVAASPFAADFVRPFLGSETPIRTVAPFVQPSVFDRLGAVDPDLDSQRVVFVGNEIADCKGVDLLVAAWETVRERFPDARLTIVGGGHPPEYDERPGVDLRGFVDHTDLPEVLAAHALYVQPSRVDPHPVSALEALRAGLPVVATHTTGTREEVRAVDPSLVVDPTADAIAGGIVSYLSRTRDARQRLSERARERGARFDKESAQAAFRRAFEGVLADAA
ncbi:glycosyltransferase family 4 protein [Halomarina litorea]|uniref:glycosyltransferase family 4 protein n=1 Tax=Halomarina litorea TaxID=2961595 RepID=UPI0020C43DEC|nr:glycosyltransferase [Halomarina sp. BCD28]